LHEKGNANTLVLNRSRYTSWKSAQTGPYHYQLSECGQQQNMNTLSHMPINKSRRWVKSVHKVEDDALSWPEPHQLTYSACKMKIYSTNLQASLTRDFICL